MPRSRPMKELRHDLSRNMRKWTRPLMEAGYTCLPNVIIEKQHGLGLSALDINILLHLASYWWEADNLPHPAKRTIAVTIGVRPRTVQRRIAEMERDGLIQRVSRTGSHGGSTTNNYDFSGLIEKVTPFAIEKRKQRMEQKKDRETLRRRKKQVLAVVASDLEGSES